MENTRIKQLGLLAGLLVAVVLLIGFSNIVSRAGKIPIAIEVAPSIAQSKIDGKSVSSGTVYVSKGKHTLSASLPDFSTETQTLIIGGDTQTFSIALRPVNPAGQKFLADNPQYQSEREAVSGRETQGRLAVDQTPLINQLPVTNLAAPYKIDFSQSKSRKNGTIILIGGSSPEGRQKALQWIRSKGYDPTDLEIQFTDFSNPLIAGSGATTQSVNTSGDGGE
jgi:hypothetical protein